MRLGVLDVGSNTIHLQIMDSYIGSAPIPFKSCKREIRLAEYLEKDGTISDLGVKTLVRAIKDVFNEAHDVEIDETLAFATSAIREAANSEEVISTVESQTGINIEVLSGDEEATFTFLAARRWFGWHLGELLIIDIGGGSLELAYGEQEVPTYAQSFTLGAGRLTRQWLEGDPFTEKSLSKLKDYVSESLQPLKDKSFTYDKNFAIATSKTLRTLQRLQQYFLPDQGQNLTREGIDLISQRLQEMTLKERRELPGISAGRAMQIVAGAIVAQNVMKRLKLDYVIQCPWALREGIVLHRIDWIK